MAKIEARKITESYKISTESELFKQEQGRKLEELRSEYMIKEIAKAEGLIK